MSDADFDLKPILHHYLRAQREALSWKLDGLGERQLRWPHTATGTNLLGLLKHAAGVEHGYFGEVFGRPCPEPFDALDDGAEPNADMWALPTESADDIRRFAERVWAHSDETIEALPLDAAGQVPWWGDRGAVTLGQILVHVLCDLARHAGHADIVREQTDGAAGLRAGNLNLPDPDPTWSAAYLERLQAVAERFD